jgi:hypothetical protein
MVITKPVAAFTHAQCFFSLEDFAVFRVEPGYCFQVSSARMKPVVITPDTAVNNHFNALKARLLIFSIDLNIGCFSSFK